MAVPNTFVQGTVANADEMNENFEYVVPEIQAKAGEALTAGQLVYIKEADGEVYIADKYIGYVDGIVLANTDADATATIQVGGKYTTTGLAANTVYYLGDNGALSTTASSQIIGVATSTTELQVNIKTKFNFADLCKTSTLSSPSGYVTAVNASGAAANILIDNTDGWGLSLDFTSNAMGAGSVGATATIDLGQVITFSKQNFKLYTTKSGSATSSTIDLSGSENGTDYTSLGSTTSTLSDTSEYMNLRYLKITLSVGYPSGSASGSGTALIRYLEIVKVK